MSSKVYKADWFMEGAFTFTWDEDKGWITHNADTGEPIFSPYVKDNFTPELEVFLNTQKDGVTYDQISKLKTPSHNKVDRDDLMEIYVKAKAQGYDLNQIQSFANGLKKKRYNAYASKVKKYNNLIAGYNETEKNLLDLMYNKEVERHSKDVELTEEDKESLYNEMKIAREKTGRFKTFEVAYEDEHGNTIKHGDTSSYDNITKRGHNWEKNQNINTVDLKDNITSYMNDDFVAGTLEREYGKYGFKFWNTSNWYDGITAKNTITGETFEIETNFASWNKDKELAEAQDLVDWMKSQPQLEQGNKVLISTEEYETRKEIDAKIADLEVFGDIDYEWVMENEEENAVDYLNKRFKENINNNLVIDGVEFSAEETGWFNIDAANIYKTVNGKKSFVQRIAFDHNKSDQAKRELAFLEQNIKKEIERSHREEIVVKRDQLDIEQIDTDRYILHKDTGIQYSENDVIDMFEKEHGPIKFVPGTDEFTKESEMLFTNFVDDFVGWDGEATGIMNQLQIRRRGEQFRGGDQVRIALEDLIYNDGGIDSKSEDDIKTEIQNIFGFTGMEVAWMNDKLELRIGDEMFTLNPNMWKTDDSEIINTTYEILTAYKNLSTDEIAKTVIGGVLDDEGYVLNVDDYEITGDDFIVKFGRTYNDKLKDIGLSNVRCIDYDMNMTGGATNFNTIQYDYKGETYTVDISDKTTGVEYTRGMSTKRSLRPSVVLESIMEDIEGGKEIYKNLASEAIKFKDKQTEKFRKIATERTDPKDNISELLEGQKLNTDKLLNISDPNNTNDFKSLEYDNIKGTNVSFHSVLKQIIKEGGGKLSSEMSEALRAYFGLYGDLYSGYIDKQVKSGEIGTKYTGWGTLKEGWQEGRRLRSENFNAEDFIKFFKSGSWDYDVYKKYKNGKDFEYYAELQSVEDAIKAMYGKEDWQEGMMYIKREENPYSQVWNTIKHEVTNQRENVEFKRLFEDFSAENPDIAPLLDLGSMLQVEPTNQSVQKLLRRNFETDVFVRKTFNNNKLRLQVIADEIKQTGAWVDPETFLLQNTDQLAPTRVDEINKELQEIKSLQEEVIENANLSYGDVSEELLKLQREKEDNEIVAEAAQKKYGGLNSFLISAEASFAQLALALPMLFQNDAAIAAYASINRAKAITLPTPIAYDEEMNSRQYREFLGRTFGDQAANTTLALATAGAGSYFSLSTKTLTSSQAALFGIQTAGIDMGITTEADWRAENARDQKEDLQEMFEKGYISEENFKKKSEVLDQIIMENDSNLLVRYLNSSLKGLVEGIVMKKIGTAVNANSILGVGGSRASLNNMVNQVSRRTHKGLVGKFYQYGGGAILDTGKRLAVQTGGEVIEEVLAEAGQGVVDALVMDTYRALELGQDYKGWERLKETWNNLDDVAVSALINGGGMSSSGLLFQAPAAYNNIRSIMKNGVLDHYRKSGMNGVYQQMADNINLEKQLVEKLSYLSPEDDSYQTKRDQLLQLREEMAISTEAIGIDFASLSKKQQAQLYVNTLQLHNIETAAGVKAGMSADEKLAKVESYAKTKDSKQRRFILDMYKTASESTARIMNTISYDKDSAYEIFGEAGLEMQQRFERDKRYKKYKNASKRQKLALISQGIKADMINRGIDVLNNRYGKEVFQEHIEKQVYSIENWNYNDTEPTSEQNPKRIPVTFEQYQRITGKKKRILADGVIEGKNVKGEARRREEFALQYGIVDLNQTSTLYNQGKELQANVLEMAGDLSQVEVLDQGQDKYKDKETGTYKINPETNKPYTEQEVYQKTRDKLRDQLIETFRYENTDFNPEEEVEGKNQPYYVNIDKVNEILKAFDKGEIKGAFVQTVDGKKYIVQDKDAADANLAKGDLLQGTMMHHEVGHAVDLLALQGKTLEETKQNIMTYSDNLFEYASVNLKNQHAAALFRLETTDHYIFKGLEDFISMDPYRKARERQLEADPNVRPEDISTIINEEIYKIKNEYTRYLGEEITHEITKQDAAGRSLADPDVQKVMNIKRSVIDRIIQRDSKFFPDTPKKAIQYAISYIRGTQEGNIGKIAGELIVGKKFQAGDQNTLMSRVRKQSEGLLTKEERDALVKNVNDNYAILEEARNELEGEKDEIVRSVLEKRANDARNTIIESYRGMAEKRFEQNLTTAPTGTNIQNLISKKDDVISDMLYEPGTKETDEDTGKVTGAKSRSVLGMIDDFKREKHKYENLAAYINTLFKRRSYKVFSKYDTAFTKQLEFATNELVAIEEDFDANTELSMISKGDIVLNETIAKSDPNEVVGDKAKQHTANVQDIVSKNPSEFEGKTFKQMKDLDPRSTVEMMVGNDDLVFVDDGSPVWKTPQGKKILGTSVVESIVKKLKNNANLNAQEIRPLQRFIRRHTMFGDVSNLLWKSFPQGFELDVVKTKEGIKTRPGKAVGVNTVLLEKGYNKSSKRIGNGYPQYKKPITGAGAVNEYEFQSWFGINPRGEADYVGREVNVSDTIKAFIRLHGGVATKQATKQWFGKNGTDLTKQRLRFENGMSDILFSKVTAQNLDKFPKLREANANFLELISRYYGFNNYAPTMKYSDRNIVNKFYKINRDQVIDFMKLAGIPPSLHSAYYDELYGETGQIKNIAMIKRNRDGIKVEAIDPIPGIIEIMDGRVDDAIVDVKLQEVLGADQSIAETYSDPDSINIARDNIKKEALVKMIELGIKPTSNGWDNASLDKKTEFIQFVLDNVGSYARAAQIGNRSISINEEGGQAFKIPYFEGIKISDNRKQVTEGIGDYAALINQVIPGVTILPVIDAPKRGNQEAGERNMNGIIRRRTEIQMAGEGGINEMYPGLKKDYSEKTEAVRKELVKKKGIISLTTAKPRKNQALRFRSVYKTRFENMINRLVDPEDTFGIHDAQMFFGTESSGMDAVGRRSAYLYGITEDIFTLKNLGKTMEYDHAKPNNTLMIRSAELLKAVQEGEISTKDALAQLDIFFEDYHVNAIPKTMDQAIKTAGYQSLLTGKYKPGSPVENLGWASRIFNDIVKYDPRLRPIIVVDPDFQGNVIGNESVRAEHRVKATSESLVEQSKEQISPEMSMVQYENHRTVNKAVYLSRAINHETPSRGMSAFDFDETLIDKGENFIVAKKGDDVVNISSEQWPLQGPDFAAKGYEFDFTDFINVRGGVEGPLMQKFRNRIEKFGIENTYILTARPPESAPAIQAWLKQQEIDMPIENITGLGNSTGEAKAMWIAQKYSEGYNDIYFVDDALPNVTAVKDMMNQLDIKGSSVQAKIQFSRSINPTINDILDSNIQRELDINRILEQSKGVKAEAVFSEAQAKIRGAKKGKWKFFVPPSAEDFKGLIYRFVGKGRQGEQHMAFFKKALFDPYSRAYEAMNGSKQQLHDQYNTLLKEFKGVKKDLKKKISNFEGFDSDFTVDQAIRVYLWDKNGMEVPGISQRDLKQIIDFINSQEDIRIFANSLEKIVNQEQGYLEPTEYWLVENIQSDILKINNEISRADHLTEWRQNKEQMFGVWGNDGRLVGDNINKIEAIYGTRFREALEDMLWRMEFGTKREAGRNRLVNAFNNWANQSVGAIMFFNMRSALLQTISSVNYINWTDNNPLKAGMALANFPQFIKDFTFIFNSDMLKQRRAGNQRGINEAELAQAVAGVGPANRVKAMLHYLLTKGFLPTQIADSFAISSGGATFYRNRVNSYLKQGMTKEQAESRAWSDFQENTEASQQSSRPDMISQQQASPLGRYILAFKNTPMQYARLMKKAWLDIANRRGDFKTNLSKIIYYGAVQNLIFTGLQSALGALIGDDDEKDKDLHKRIANSMIDNILGGLGFGGNAVATVKNTILEYIKQDDKGWGADHTYTILKFFSLSPTVGSKGRKLYSAIQTRKYNKDVIGEMNMLDIDNPNWSVIANIISSTTNIPLDRLVKKVDNLDAAITEDITTAQRLALFFGWNTWDLGVEDSDIIAVEDEIQEKKKKKKEEEKKIKKKEREEKEKEENKDKEKENRKKNDGGCVAISRSGNRCKNKAESGGYCTIHAKVEKRTDGKKTQCTKIKSDGKRCKMKTSAKSGRCYYHD